MNTVGLPAMANFDLRRLTVPIAEELAAWMVGGPRPDWLDSVVAGIPRLNGPVNQIEALRAIGEYVDANAPEALRSPA